MFIFLYFNRLKILVRNKAHLFWTLFFPIILATFFFISFTNINSSDSFKKIPVVIVNDDSYQNSKSFSDTMNTLNDAEDPIIAVHLADTMDDALKMLDNETVSGIISITNEKPQLFVKSSGINQTILKNILDQYISNYNTITALAQTNPAALNQTVLNHLAQYTNYTISGNLVNQDLNYILISYYALLAMACMYGSFWGVADINDIQADQSTKAARVNSAPTHKMKVLVTNLCASLTIQFIEVLILVVYMAFVLNVNFGNHIFLVLMTCLIASILGISIGTMVGSLFKVKEGLKTGILVAFSMLCCFLAGMMSPDIKYMVLQNIPILAAINPANLISDAFYNIYLFDGGPRWITSMITLSAFSLLAILITYLKVRREQYASL